MPNAYFHKHTPAPLYERALERVSTLWIRSAGLTVAMVLCRSHSGDERGWFIFLPRIVPKEKSKPHELPAATLGNCDMSKTVHARMYLANVCAQV